MRSCSPGAIRRSARGVDLKEAQRDGLAYFDQFRSQSCLAAVAQMRTPIVGAVNGATFTGGLEMALGCDFLVASERAVFADTHARVGILPGGGMTARLPQLVGMATARRLSMTGEVVDAAFAERIGLVSEVVEHDRRGQPLQQIFDLNDLVSAGYLHTLPIDPFTHSDTTWEPVQEDVVDALDQTEPGITDVHSGSPLRASDGTAYSSW